jgi:hypothetical protein
MGRYQKFLYVTLASISLLTGGLTLMTPFLFYQDHYKCPEETLSSKQCYDKVCALPLAER